jgi:hypothetical protein
MWDDLHVHPTCTDLQKTMMAVLVAMQEERDRKEAEAAATPAEASN